MNGHGGVGSEVTRMTDIVEKGLALTGEQ